MIAAWRWEWFKLLVKNRGLVLLGLLAAVHILGIVFAVDVAYYQEPAAIQAQLNRYYQAYGGRLTAQTMEKIEEKNDAIAAAAQASDLAFGEFESGAITAEELDARLADVTPLLQEQAAFREFYSRYTYSKESPETRYLLDLPGWESLLNPEEPDFVLFFLTILLVMLLYAADNKQDMADLLKPTCEGYTRLFYIRLLTAACAAILMGVLAQGFSLLKTAIYFPLEGGGAPLQSLSAYAASPYSLTLAQGFLLGSLLRLFGLLFAGLLAACAMELLGNPFRGGLAAFALTVIPYFAGYTDNLYLQWPYPVGFVQAFPYLAGLSVGRQQQPAGLRLLLTVLALSLLVLALLCIAARFRYRRPYLERKGRAEA